MKQYILMGSKQINDKLDSYLLFDKEIKGNKMSGAILKCHIAHEQLIKKNIVVDGLEVEKGEILISGDINKYPKFIIEENKWVNTDRVLLIKETGVEKYLCVGMNGELKEYDSKILDKVVNKSIIKNEIGYTQIDNSGDKEEGYVKNLNGKYAVIAVIKKDGNIVGLRVMSLNDDNIYKKVDKRYSDAKIESIKKLIENGTAKFINIKVFNNKVVGSNGSLERYPTIENGKLSNPKLIILAQIENIGYVISNCWGEVKKVRNESIIEFAEDSNVGVANGKIVLRNNDKFVSSIDGKYDVLKVQRNKQTEYVFDGKKDVINADKFVTKSTSNAVSNSLNQNDIFKNINSEQKQLLTQYYIEYTARYFNNAVKARREISTFKISEFAELKGDIKEWKFAGMCDLGFVGAGYCDLGHPIRYAHYAVPAVDDDELYYDGEYDDYKITFGETCSADFFNIDPKAMADLVSARKRMTNELRKITYDVEAGYVDGAWEELRPFTDVVALLGTPEALVEIFGDEVGGYLFEFIKFDIPFPRSLIRDAIDAMMGKRVKAAKLIFKNIDLNRMGINRYNRIVESRIVKGTVSSVIPRELLGGMPYDKYNDNSYTVYLIACFIAKLLDNEIGAIYKYDPIGYAHNTLNMDKDELSAYRARQFKDGKYNKNDRLVINWWNGIIKFKEGVSYIQLLEKFVNTIDKVLEFIYAWIKEKEIENYNEVNAVLYRLSSSKIRYSSEDESLKDDTVASRILTSLGMRPDLFFNDDDINIKRVSNGAYFRVNTLNNMEREINIMEGILKCGGLREVLEEHKKDSEYDFSRMNKAVRNDVVKSAVVKREDMNSGAVNSGAVNSGDMNSDAVNSGDMNSDAVNSAAVKRDDILNSDYDSKGLIEKVKFLYEKRPDLIKRADNRYNIADDISKKYKHDESMSYRQAYIVRYIIKEMEKEIRK